MGIIIFLFSLKDMLFKVILERKGETSTCERNIDQTKRQKVKLRLPLLLLTHQKKQTKPSLPMLPRSVNIQTYKVVQVRNL